MPKTLSEVLAAEDDLHVCSGLYSLLVTRYGKFYDPADLPVEHRTVMVVWHSHTLIGNGGFNGFLKADLPGDPGYTHLLAAYQAVGCEPTLTALCRVLDVFPNRVPPADPAERLRLFLKENTASHGALNRDFLKSSNDLVAALAAYIRSRPEAFADVEKPGAGYAVANAAVAPVEEPTAPIRAENLATKVAHLPRWARAAFHAHSAHLAFKLWDDAWPEAPHEYRDGIEQAILLAELCAAQGEAVGDLKSAAELAVAAAEAAATSSDGKRGGPFPNDPAAATNIALSAAVALDFIRGDDEADIGFATAALETSRRRDLLEQLQGDLNKLKKMAREGGWTEKTPVPPEIFRPDFEASGKSWWKRW